MPETFRVVNPSDVSVANYGSFMNQAVRTFDGYVNFFWTGRVTITSGAIANSNVTRYDPQKGITGKGSLIIPANTGITLLGIYPQGALTSGVATGKLKLSATLTASTAGLYVVSAAASGGVLAAPTAWVTSYSTTPVTIGASELTFKLFATDAGAVGSEAAGTMSAAANTDVLIMIAGRGRDDLPSNLGIFSAPSPVTSNNYS